MEIIYILNKNVIKREVNVAYLNIFDRVIYYYLPDKQKHVIEPLVNISNLEVEGAELIEPGYYVPEGE